MFRRYPCSSVAFFAVQLLLAVPWASTAAVIHVPGDQPTIQAAIDAAANGDTVLVAPGTYVENIDFTGKAITVRSAEGPEATVIDGGEPTDPIFGSVATFVSGEGPDAVLQGFTLTHGEGFYEYDPYYGGYRAGGGIYYEDASPTIIGNVISENTGLDRGGAVYGFGGAPTFIRNLITGNSAYSSGGMHIGSSSASISRNTIVGNEAFNGYGGASCSGSMMKITDNIISGNTAEYVAGIYVSSPPPSILAGNLISENHADEDCGGLAITTSPIIINNIIEGNTAGGRGGGIECADSSTDALLFNMTIVGNTAGESGGGILLFPSSTLTITSSILWDNDAPVGPEIYARSGYSGESTITIDYCDVQGGQDGIALEPGCLLLWGAGMIDADPLFTTGPQDGHYLSQTAAGQPVDSPCVDSGNPASDHLWGTTRTDGVQDSGLVDMGYHHPRQEGLVVAPGPANENPPWIRVFPPMQDASCRFQFAAYAANRFGADVTCGDVNGDGIDEILTGAGPGIIYGPHVRGFAVDGTPLPGLSFLAYGTLKYGVRVAAGDIDGDGTDEIVTGAGPGAVFGPHVRAFDYDGGPQVTPTPGVSYFAYGTQKWGVNVSCGDIDGDGTDEIVTGAGPGAVFGPHVRGWDCHPEADPPHTSPIPAVNFFAYGTPQWGVRVTCGDMDGDGIDELVTAPGPGAEFGAHVRGWNYDGQEISELSGLSFFAWPPSEARDGAAVFAGADLDQDGRNEILVGAGPDPDVDSRVQVLRYDGNAVDTWFTFRAFPEDWTHGANVTGGAFSDPARFGRK